MSATDQTESASENSMTDAGVNFAKGIMLAACFIAVLVSPVLLGALYLNKTFGTPETSATGHLNAALARKEIPAPIPLDYAGKPRFFGEPAGVMMASSYNTGRNRASQQFGCLYRIDGKIRGYIDVLERKGGRGSRPGEVIVKTYFFDPDELDAGRMTAFCRAHLDAATKIAEGRVKQGRWPAVPDFNLN